MPDIPMELLKVASRRLFIAIAILFALLLGIAAVGIESRYIVPIVVIGAGFLGGFIGLQGRLKDLTERDLTLLRESWPYTSLSPLVGGVLALLLYILFLSQLLAGQLFPLFTADANYQLTDFSALLHQHANSFADYAKLLFWAFVAGYSERFVTDVIKRFVGDAVKSAPNGLANGADEPAPVDGAAGQPAVS